ERAARMPNSIVRMASTQAKIGRSMKKRDMLLACVRKLRLHGNAWAQQGPGIDDNLVAGLDAATDEPVGADGSVGLDHPKLGHIVLADDDERRTPALVTADRALRDEHAARLDALRHLAADEHSREEQMLRIGEDGADGLRSRCRVDRHVGEAE